MQGCQEKLLTAAAPQLIADVLASAGRVRFRALGSSMVPAVRSGDELTIERCPLEAVRLGDIVLTRQGARLVAHRLIRKERNSGGMGLVTRGDALWHADPVQPASALLGRAVGSRRCGALQRLYGLASTEVTRLARAVREVVSSRAATSLNTTIGSANSSGQKPAAPVSRRLESGT